MRHTLLQISAVLFATLAFVTAGGLFSSLTSLRGTAEGLGPLFVGLTGSVYYGGFLIGCLLCPRLVLRSGHIRSFATAAALAGLAPLLLVSFVAPFPWLIGRFAAGVAFAMLYAVVESWINDRADNLHRGRIFSIYVLVTHLANFSGQGLLLAAPLEDDRLFYLVTALFIVALVPVTQTRAINPSPPEAVRTDPRLLWQLSPVAAVTTLVNGLANGAAWIVGPVVIAALFGPEMVGLVMPCYLIGGLLGQWPLGRASDFADRRLIILLAAVAAVAGSCLAVVQAGSGPGLFALCLAVIGLGNMSSYAIASAHANDRGRPEQTVVIASTMLLFYGTGAAIGPLVAAAMVGWAGPAGLFFYLGAVFLFWAVYTAWRIARRSAPEVADSVVPLAVQHGPALASPDLRIFSELETGEEEGGEEEGERGGS